MSPACPLVIPVDPTAPSLEALEQAAGILNGGGLVAFPTETVYGLGADARNVAAVARIFAAKGRPADNPLIVHVASRDQARDLARDWSETAELLANRFWPGPLTLLVPKRPEIPDMVTAGLPAVGLRMPSHPVARALLMAAGCPIAAPSANPYMAISPTTAGHVIGGLGDRVDLVLDGGPCPVGIESTVLDVTGPVPVVLRPGGVSLADIRRVVPSAIESGPIITAGAHSSPGQAKRHYAPRIPLTLVTGRRALLRAALAQGPLAVITVGAAPPELTGTLVKALPSDPAGYAAALYATLHDLDQADLSAILVERPPGGPAWAAIADRLARAAEPATDG